MSLLTTAIGEIQKPSWWGSLPASSNGQEKRRETKGRQQQMQSSAKS